MAKKPEMPKMDFEKLIEKGENPLGFTSQTANGTAHWQGTGWNRDVRVRAGLKCRRTPRAPSGRSNRTGE
jgi:hypothetical protein